MASPTPFVDLALARRLERTEGRGGAEFVEARKALEPEHGATWVCRGGVYAMFDGVDSPVTQTFALGLEDTPTASDLDQLEAFFIDRHSDVNHEVSPIAGVSLFSTLSARGYVPIELTSVMFCPVSAETSAAPAHADGGSPAAGVRVRRMSMGDAELFGATAARGWSEVPELGPFLQQFGRVMASRTGGPCFLAEIDGEPAATGALVLCDGVALLAGASTIPKYRRRGAQLALLDARLRFAATAGCDLAMMCAAPGSASQRNAERNGFRIAYTRVKWQLKRCA